MIPRWSLVPDRYRLPQHSRAPLAARKTRRREWLPPLGWASSGLQTDLHSRGTAFAVRRWKTTRMTSPSERCTSAAWPWARPAWWPGEARWPNTRHATTPGKPLPPCGHPSSHLARSAHRPLEITQLNRTGIVLRQTTQEEQRQANGTDLASCSLFSNTVKMLLNESFSSNEALAPLLSVVFGEATIRTR